MTTGKIYRDKDLRKDTKKLTTFRFACPNKQMSELRIALERDGMVMGEFFRDVISAYLYDKEFVPILNKIRNRISNHNRDTLEKITLDMLEGEAKVKLVNPLSEEEKNDFFDLLEGNE